MHDQLQMKSPADFTDLNEWRDYIERTVPRDEAAYVLAFGRTILFARFYEVRKLAFPERFCAQLLNVVSLQEPIRTQGLEALNDQIFADMTELLCAAARTRSRQCADVVDAHPRRVVDDLIKFLAQENPYFRAWVHYAERSVEHRKGKSWEEFAIESLGIASEQHVKFALLMAQLGRLLVHFRAHNLPLPVDTVSRSWFLHYLHGAERNAQARAVVQALTETLHPCACA
jgi:hypothetical protein